MRRFLPFLIVLTVLLSAGAAAQPVLDAKRAVVQWPNVHLFYDITCGGLFSPSHSAANLSLTEDGLPVSSFTQSCPDTTVHCEMSTSLVFDMSASMLSQWMVATQRAGTAFIDKMNGTTDEAAILFFNQTVTVEQPMTTQKSSLYNAFSNYMPSGATATFDAAYAGVDQAINNGSNSCKAVVLMTDGADNASVRTPDDIITLATNNFVRVITIAIGSSVNPAPLQRIADSTGGRFFSVTDTLDLPPTYREIFEFISDGFRECELVYQVDCPDGAYHEAMLTVNNVCGGSARDSIDVLRPAIPTNQFDLDIYGPDSLVVEAGTTVDLIFINKSLFTGTKVLQPFDLGFYHNKSHLQLRSLEIPQASPLTGTTVNMIPFGTNFLISSNSAVFTGPASPFFTLRFAVQDRQDSTVTTISQVTAQADKGCLVPRLHRTEIRIIVPPRPVIEALGPASICPGDSVTLRVTEEFDSYKWTTGDTTRSITVHRDGPYAVEVMDYAGRTAVSPAFLVEVYPGASPKLTATDTLSLCAGKDAVLGTTEQFAQYRWSTGDTTATITVTDAGNYYVEATDGNGCTGVSDTLVVVLDDPVVTITPSGTVDLCGGDTLMLEADAGFASYRWSHGVSGRIAPVTQPGSYAVMATNLAGCTAWSDSVTVTQRPRPQASIMLQGPPILCPGDSLLLEAPAGFAGYEWSTGAVTRQVFVRQPGTVWLKVTGANGCASVPDSVDIVTTPRPILQPSGVHVVCFGETFDFDGGPGYAGYSWNTGDTTRVLEADASGDYWVDVTDAGGCVLRSDTVTLVVRPEITPVIDVEGSLSLCEGDSVVLRAPAGYRDYYWSSGETSSSIVVRREGRYAVTVYTNEACSGTSDTLDVEVLPRPDKPIVTRQGDVLTASSAHAYQWYRDGIALAGETRQTHIARINGDYHVVVFNQAGCSRASDPIEVIVVSVHTLARVFSIEAWPDPNQGRVTVSTELPEVSSLRITVLNILGQPVAELSEPHAHGTVTRSIDLTQVPRGVYLLRVQAGGRVHTRRIVRQ